MLNDLLGWIVALGSLGLYLSRFFLPEVQRKNDAIWSGVGLFYALILWANGDRIKGGLLLGQMASVALIVWLGWQALKQRRQLTAPQDQTPLPESVQSSWPFVKTGLDRLASTIKDGPSSNPEIAQGSSSEKKEFKIGGLTLPFDLSALLATVKGSPSQGTGTIPKASSADGKDEDWGDEVVSEPSTPQEPVEETVEAVATETVISEVAIAPNEPEQPLEPSNTEETPTQADESTGISTGEAIAEPEAVGVTTEADRNQPSSEADLSETTEETVETSSETSEEDSVASVEAMQPAQETPSEESEAVAHEEAAHPPGSETDDGSWPPQDPVT
jgi:Ycf66 protein N-terminus